MRNFLRFVSATAATVLVAVSPLAAQETKTYTYDALGRLVAVEESGGPNNQTTTSYNYDPAGNRTQVSTAGSGNTGGGNNGGGASVSARRGFVVTPLGTYALIFYRD